MNNDLEEFKRKLQKCVDAINGIHALMKRNRIQLPSKYQKSRVHEDLPETPERKEGTNVLSIWYCEYVTFITIISRGSFTKVSIPPARK